MYNAVKKSGAIQIKMPSTAMYITPNIGLINFLYLPQKNSITLHTNTMAVSKKQHKIKPSTYGFKNTILKNKVLCTNESKGKNAEIQAVVFGSLGVFLHLTPFIVSSMVITDTKTLIAISSLNVENPYPSRATI
jgi:hypothetical protein